MISLHVPYNDTVIRARNLAEARRQLGAMLRVEGPRSLLAYTARGVMIVESLWDNDSYTLRGLAARDLIEKECDFWQRVPYRLLAAHRVYRSPSLRGHYDILIAYDWPDPDHYQAVATRPIAETLDWVWTIIRAAE